MYLYPGERKEHMESNKTVKNMPRLERPYEKCLTFGASGLSDAELLAVILKTGTKDKTSIDLSREIISLNQKYEGLAGIHHLTYEQLLSIKGVGNAKAVQILCLCEIAKRISGSKAKERLEFDSPASVAEYLMEEMRYLQKEEVRVLMFDGRHSLIGEAKISVGTVNAALSSPREVYLEALKCQAVYIILIHNHPSGDPMPSSQDMLLTKQMMKAGMMIGIELSDHIIIGNQKFYSFRENGFFS